MNELFGMIFIYLGIFFALVGSIGLIRLPDVFARLQAAAKCVTFGVCLMLFGISVMFAGALVSYKALLCALFIILTSPASAHAIARGAYLYGAKPCKGSVIEKYKPLAAGDDKE